MNKKILLKVLAAMMLLVAFSTVAFATPDDDQNNASSAAGTPVEPDICYHESTYEVVSYPTCTATGSIKVICDECGKVVETKTIDANGHEMKLDKEVAPTCTEDGYRLYVCVNTGCTHTETETIDAVGHDWHFVRVYQEDTCTQVGLKLYKCLMCENYDTVEFDEVHHDWELQTRVEPTCTKDGYEVYYCTICGATETEVLTALGHQWTAWNIDVSPSCEEDGLRSRYCTRDCCYDGNTMSTVKETEVIPAHGHLIDVAHATIVEATETTDGSITGICVYCSNTVTEVIPATGSSADDKADSENGAANGTTNSGSNGSANRPATNSSGVTIPATGDSANAAPIAMVVVAFIGLAVLTATKQKVHG